MTCSNAQQQHSSRRWTVGVQQTWTGERRAEDGRQGFVRAVGRARTAGLQTMLADSSPSVFMCRHPTGVDLDAPSGPNNTLHLTRLFTSQSGATVIPTRSVFARPWSFWFCYAPVAVLPWFYRPALALSLCSTPTQFQGLLSNLKLQLPC